MKRGEYVFRISALNERKEFYNKEFSIKKAKAWFKSNKINLPQICALDPGSETGIAVKKRLKGKMLYFPFNEMQKKIKQYYPEDLYYVRNQYRDSKEVLKTMKVNTFVSQELIFDVDADNIKCNHPKDQDACRKCLNKGFEEALKIKIDLRKTGFKKIIFVYSGRGIHVHVLDKKAFLLTKKQRRDLTKKFLKYPIDPWVSEGYIDLIRVPYSLNSLVSRKAIPINNKRELYSKAAIPNFLRN